MNNPPIDPEALRPYFYWLGITFHSCHQLEYGVKTVLVTMADMGFGGFNLSDMIAIIEEEKKNEVDDRVANPETRAGVITEVKAIRRSVLEADRPVQQILETLYKHAGLDWHELRSKWAEDIRALNTPGLSDPPKANGAG